MDPVERSGRTTGPSVCDNRPRVQCHTADVNSVLSGLIAVLGTLAGSSLTYLFGRLTARRTERVAREERLRQDRIAAYARFVGAMTDLRQAVISLWFLKRDKPDAPEVWDAHREADKRGADAHHARFSVQLLTEDAELLELADSVFVPVDALVDAEDRAELRALEDRSEEMLAAFIRAAGPHVR